MPAIGERMLNFSSDLAALIVVLAALLAIAASFVSLLPNHWWGIRVLDLVREPLNYILLTLGLLTILLVKDGAGWILAGICVAIVTNYAMRWPYSRFARAEIALGKPQGTTPTFTILCANVLMENTDHARMLRQIERVDPDVLILTEIDDQWVAGLQPVLNHYPFTEARPQDDTFGKLFASRLETVRFEFRERDGEDTPALRIVLNTPCDRRVMVVCIHPEAPLPGHGEITEPRDRSIANAAHADTDHVAGAIVMGDFNDVPWSPPTAKFLKMEKWRDPRVGRGTFPTFPSFLWPIGWPLDQLFVSGRIGIASFKILPANGSDHRAVYGEFYIED